MEIFLVPMLIGIIIAPPFMSAMMAETCGRKYWTWFFIGCILPIIANIILFILPDKKKETQN